MFKYPIDDLIDAALSRIDRGVCLCVMLRSLFQQFFDSLLAVWTAQERSFGRIADSLEKHIG